MSEPPGVEPTPVESEEVEPERVARCRARARGARFLLSCQPGIGSLLAALSAAVPRDGRILELGTGAGVGLAWIAEGLGQRTDVDVVSVELAEEMAELARQERWPERFRLVLGDGAEEVCRQGRFDLIFADAPGGKLIGLDDTVSALAPGGILLGDDMDPALHEEDGLKEALARVRDELTGHPQLVSAELSFSSGALLSVRRADLVA